MRRAVLRKVHAVALLCLAAPWAAPAGAAPFLGPEIVLPAGPGCPLTEPRVATLATQEVWMWQQGADLRGAVFPVRGEQPAFESTLVSGFSPPFRLAENDVVAWVAWTTLAGVELRQVAALGGASSAPPRLLALSGVDEVDLAVDPIGRLLVVWEQAPGEVLGQHLDAEGRPNGGSFRIAVARPGVQVVGVSVESLPAGPYIVAWREVGPDGDRIVAYRVPGGGAADLGPKVIAEDIAGGLTPPSLGADTGGVVIAWGARADRFVWQQFDFALEPFGGEHDTPETVSIPPGAFGADVAPSLAVVTDGQVVLAWPDGPEVVVAHFNAFGEPLGSLLRLGGRSEEVARSPDVSLNDDGVLSVVWGSGPAGNGAPPDCGLSRTSIRGQHVALGDCFSGALCLLGDRFQVTVNWNDPYNGGSGVGTPVPLTDDTGSFWFFEPNNLEMMVKVLDGRVINDHFWVFFGSLTNVEFDLRVRDRLTGRERSYDNPPFVFASEGDTTAFSAAAPSP